MFEYLNLGALVIVGFLLFVIVFVGVQRKKMPYVMIIVTLLLIGGVFMKAWNDSDKVEENIAGFKSQKVLKCFSGGGFYSSAETYRVSSRDGWKLYKGEFVKESLVLKPSRCEIW